MDFVKQFNKELIKFTELSKQAKLDFKEGLKHYLEEEDTSKFDSLDDFLTSLLVLFNHEPARLTKYMIEKLLPLYETEIKENKKKVLKNPTIDADL